MVFKVSANAVNETMCKRDVHMDPNEVMFTVLTRYPVIIISVPARKENMDAIISTEAETTTVVSKRRVLKALVGSISRAEY